MSTISGTINQGITLSANGAYASPMTITATGAVNSRYGVGIYGPRTTAWSVANLGQIYGPGGGIDLLRGGLITNSGLVAGGYYGIRVGGAPATVTNTGIISANGVYGFEGTGVILAAGGTIVDSGAISGVTGIGGGAAIYFGGNGANLLVLEPGYSISGGIVGNGAVGATNTLELAGSVGASLTVNYNTLGLSNFRDVLFGAAGYDTLKISNTSGTLPVAMSGFTLTSEAIDLTAIGTNGTITQNDTVGHRLTVSGSGGTVTLLLDSTDGTNLKTASDGTGGTLVSTDTTTPVEPQSTLPVAIGGTATISHAFLSSDDPDNSDAQQTYTVAIAPQHGTLYLNGAATESFTQADIDNGLVQYVENGDAVSSDFFGFKLSDPAGNFIGPEPYRIAILDATGPQLLTNGALQVDVGGAALLSTNSLDTVALGNSPDQITYRIVSAPAHGAVIMNRAPVTSLTQADIDDHRVIYASNGDTVAGDGFTFQVADRGGDYTAIQTFAIDLSGGSAPPPATTISAGLAVLATATPEGTVSVSTISGTINNGITLGTSGAYASPLTVTATGAVNSGGNAIYGPGTAAWSVANYGHISGGANGISLGDGGTVTNYGGVSGGYKGLAIFGAAGTVRNSGTISAPAQFPFSYYGFTYFGVGIGVDLGSGGSVTNAAGGLIEAGIGVALYQPGVITNAGIIISASGPGVSLAAASTVANSGTITGGNGVAIAFYGGGSNLVILEPGYALQGSIRGNASASNTLELQGSAGTGLTIDYNKLRLTNFQDVLISSGGSETLKISNNSGTLPVTISGFATAGDVIDLTAVGADAAITQEDTTTHQLTVSGSGGTVRLQLDSTDATAFTTASDGASGLNLTPGLSSGAPPARDFDGDGRSDVLWHNGSNGDTGYWITDSSGMVTGFHDFGQGATTYGVVGTGDFAGDGRPEVLWHNSTNGDTGYWITDSSGTVTGFHDFGQGDTTYDIAGIGDFDGDGRADVLWHNSSNGDTGYWITDGNGTVTGFHDFGQGATTYSVAGVGNFDGKPDVLWHNSSNGDTGYWITDSSGTVTGFDDFGQGNTAYAIAGIGDFDGSGKAEILWHNASNGDTGYWTTDSAGTVTGFHDFGFGDISYSVAAVGDYDGDGRSDVLWHNQTTGDTGYWVTSTAGAVTGFHDFGLGSTAYNVISS